MLDSQRFWDKSAPGYIARPIDDMEGYTHTLSRTRSYLKDTDRVLELGCGSGNTALLLAQNVAHITASDLSAQMIKDGPSRAQAEGVRNITFLHADLFEDAFPDAPYDAVLAHSLIHLIPDQSGALARVADLVRPGGFFISKTVTSSTQGAALKWRLLKLALPIMQMLGKAPFVRFQTTEDLERAIASAGFEIVESITTPKNPMSRYIVARRLGA